MHAHDTLDSSTINRNRDRSAALFTLAVAALTAAVALLNTVPGLLPALVVGVVAAAIAHRIARVLRWRHEDREDALTAAAWRAAHPRPARSVSAARTEQEVA
jgi:hypothetical protein